MEQNKISKNGLDLITSKTKVEPCNDVDVSNYDSLEQFLSKNFKENGFIVAYLDYAVLIRKFQNGKIVLFNEEDKFDPTFIQKLRLFNKMSELLIWRTEGKWKARLRIDEEGLEMKIIEANQVLFGTTADVQNGITTLTEGRGTEIILPFEINGVDTQKNRVKIKTRNYIDFNKLGQAGYVDCRLVEFTFGYENKPIGEK